MGDDLKPLDYATPIEAAPIQETGTPLLPYCSIFGMLISVVAVAISIAANSVLGVEASLVFGASGFIFSSIGISNRAKRSPIAWVAFWISMLYSIAALLTAYYLFFDLDPNF